MVPNHVRYQTAPRPALAFYIIAHLCVFVKAVFGYNQLFSFIISFNRSRSFLIACPRWLTLFFSWIVSSAMVRSNFADKKRIVAKATAASPFPIIMPLQMPSTDFVCLYRILSYHRAKLRLALFRWQTFNF